MSAYTAAIKGFCDEAIRRNVVHSNVVLDYSDDNFYVIGVRSWCNTYWKNFTLTPKPEPVKDDAKAALMDARTTVRALIESEDARLIMMTAIKRVYDAATK